MKKSVSAVFFCKGKIFSITRQTYLRDFPGYTSFPGGKVNEGESLRDALEREVSEETGIRIDQLQSSEMILDVLELAYARTPKFNPHGFETYFFKIMLRDELKFSLDSQEIAYGSWNKPSEIIGRYHRGEALMVPPTRQIFEILQNNPETTSIKDLNYRYDEKNEVPSVEFVSDILQFFPLSNTLPPATRTNSFLIGDEDAKTVLIDPAPKDKDEYRKFITTLKKVLDGRKLDQIFLTHHHLDHHEQAPSLACEMGSDLVMSYDTKKRIEHKWGQYYFANRSVCYKKEGDILTRWKGADVIVYEVPGHDQGQLALMPTSKKWALVGDLIQSIGTVVIAAPEGDMALYFQSLERMIEFNPRIIFPSHGPPMGKVDKLVETLKHRKKREKQVQGLRDQGLAPFQMLPKIYPDLPSELHGAALETIQSHLRKLEKGQEHHKY